MKNIIQEFMPWESWKRLPENRDLEYNEAMRKYAVDRDAHFKKMLYYENQPQVKQADRG